MAVIDFYRHQLSVNVVYVCIDRWHTTDAILLCVQLVDRIFENKPS